MNARTLRASTNLASTEKPAAVERTQKLVDVKLTVQEQDHTRKEAVQKFETHPNREALNESRHEAKSRVQSVQRAVEGNDLQHGTHGVLRDLRDHSKHTVPQLYDILDERH